MRNVTATVCLLGLLCGCSNGSEPSPNVNSGGTQGAMAGAGGSAGTLSTAAGTSGASGSAGIEAGGTDGGGGSAGTEVAGGTGGSPMGGTAGTSGAGGALGGSGGAASACDVVTTKFCSDFEDQMEGQPPSGPFEVNAGDGTIVIDATRPYSGTKSIHLTSPNPGNNSTIHFNEQFMPMFDDLHGRAMFYVTAIPTNGPHWDIVYAYSANPSVQWEIGGIGEYFYFVVDPPDHALRSNVFPTGEWFCLQWEFKYGGQGGQNSFLAKIDGEVMENGEFTGPDPDGQTWSGGQWRTLVFGWTKYGGSSGVDIELWMDDIAFGEEPIDCPAVP